MDVVWQVATDKTMREVAQTLGIGERTVRNHMSAIYRKLGTETRVGVLLAMGWVLPAAGTSDWTAA